ncbi:hypothetical protein PMIN04_007724 [Paraphaeosphaeria minitans]|uniref:Cyclopentanone -monooxygenase n=1 Tax=Paraphaeosphaeria minitans TaxID=565426 RepID=A0A9P6KM88_9PLEO|nr:cyclopentanone -monooxygenase [Paraphaeosphaeria minitans]KAF9732308.1 cyclopentanone -monooxygenase [Paraphaeosphaeria minitans]
MSLIKEQLKKLSLNGNNHKPVNGDVVQELDALIVGAGFGGVWQLKRLRDEGYKVKLVECGTDYGGVWFWNRYPGARVDSAIPFYEFSDPALWEEWTWKQRFPGSVELRSYFAFVADKWDLKRDTEFETFVSSATWDDTEAKWTIYTKAGKVFKVNYFLLNTGFAAKRYIPDWKGVDSFEGTFLHPSYWPHEEPDLKGKRVAVVGTGSTGIQLAQAISEVAGHLTVFQRTCNMSMPMRQVEYSGPEQYFPKSEYPSIFEHRTDSFSGFAFNFLPRSTFDDDEEKRRQTYEELWAEGDFSYWLATYYDMLFTKEANREAYNFWRDKTRAKINDEKVAEILAPMEQPYAFGCKRISLENGYFEIFNQPNVTLVDISDKGTPIIDVTPNGIKTSEKEHEFDYIICATGYDAVTGGLKQIDIKGPSGETLSEHWSNGATTYLGMSVSGFPNMFFTYGPQGPTALCNGPTCAQLQGDWILNAINYMKERDLKKIECTKKSEDDYKELIWKLANASLLPTVDSWYMGTNIPNKPREPLIYLGGVPTYYKALTDAAANGYEGFQLS